VITNVSLVTVYVDDIDEAKAFYTEKLGFELGEDITLSEDRTAWRRYCGTTRATGSCWSSRSRTP
jgi:catechol 2,3-dioxygenase-like lactoylglutathione lyase family enzyme